MAAAGFVALQGIDAHQLGQFEEVGHAAGLFQALVQILRTAGNVHVPPVLFAQFADLINRRAKPFRRSRHAAVIPDDLAQLPVEGIHGPLAIDARAAFLMVSLHASDRVAHFGMRRRLPARKLVIREIIAHRVRNNEVAVAQPLHQRAGAQAVGSMIGEVRLADHKQIREWCSSGDNPPTSRPSCNGWPGRCASALCTDPHP